MMDSHLYLFIDAPLRLNRDRKEDLCISELGFHNTNGACFLLSQMNLDVCLCVVSLREKMPFHHVTAGLLYKGNYLNRSLSDSDSDVLASISVEELAGEVSLCFIIAKALKDKPLAPPFQGRHSPGLLIPRGGLSSQQHLFASPSTSLPNESISSSSSGSQST